MAVVDLVRNIACDICKKKSNYSNMSCATNLPKFAGDLVNLSHIGCAICLHTLVNLAILVVLFVYTHW